MCNPGSPRKTPEELASTLRRHLTACKAAASELKIRGYEVEFHYYEVDIFCVRKESL